MQSPVSKSHIPADENPFGLSVGDLMAGLLLIFILLLSYFISKFGEETKELKRLQGLVKGTIEGDRETERIKDGIIEDLEEEFRNGKTSQHVEIDVDSGALGIRNIIWFEHAKEGLTDEAQQVLDEVIPRYAKILFNKKENERAITQVIIEGHASKKGGDWKFNLKLSLDRARAALNYIAKADFKFSYKEVLGNRLSVHGRGFSQAAGELGKDHLDRKVELQFRLKGLRETSETEKTQN